MGDATRAEGVVDAAAEGLGGLDLLVSNAASGVLKPALELTAKHWDWTLDINARAFMILAGRAAPLMAEAAAGRWSRSRRWGPSG